jgi:hypothetical protein
MLRLECYLVGIPLTYSYPFGWNAIFHGLVLLVLVVLVFAECQLILLCMVHERVHPLLSGGFSSLAANPIQPYQTEAVAAYLKTKVPATHARAHKFTHGAHNTHTTSTHTHTHTHTRALSLSLSHTRTHARTRTHTNTQTYTYTHPGLQARPPQRFQTMRAGCLSLRSWLPHHTGIGCQK